MSKFPAVRIKQMKSNPPYLFFWVKRLFWYKKNSYKNVEAIRDMQQLSASETLDYIIDKQKSIIRFGDGEFGLLSGAGIYPPDSDWSQRFSKKLSSEIERQLILKNKNILLAVPPKSHLLYKENDSPQLDVISSMHIEARLYLDGLIDSEVIYGDWSVFMPQHNKDLDWEKIKNYIEHKTVVVVTGGVDKLRDITLGKKTMFVECSKHDAFERRQNIIKDVDMLIEKEELNPEKSIFWVSLGCTAGCIVEHLVEKGFVGWDTGHIFRFASKELSQLSYE